MLGIAFRSFPRLPTGMTEREFGHHEEISLEMLPEVESNGDAAMRTKRINVQLEEQGMEGDSDGFAGECVVLSAPDHGPERVCEETHCLGEVELRSMVWGGGGGGRGATC